MVSWASQIRAVALWPPSARSTRQISPAKQSATASTPGPSRQLPFSARTRSSKLKMNFRRDRLAWGPAIEVDPLQVPLVGGVALAPLKMNTSGSISTIPVIMWSKVCTTSRPAPSATARNFAS